MSHSQRLDAPPTVTVTWSECCSGETRIRGIPPPERSRAVGAGEKRVRRLARFWMQRVSGASGGGVFNRSLKTIPRRGNGGPAPHGDESLPGHRWTTRDLADPDGWLASSEWRSAMASRLIRGNAMESV